MRFVHSSGVVSSMDYMKLDGSGTDEDLPTQNFSRNIPGVRFSMTGRVPSGAGSRGMDTTDMKYQIHCIETEAYSAILRAFIAQSPLLSWGKEGLITELRKELNVSDVEHRELLVKVDSDDSLRMIREWRKDTSGEKGSHCNKMNSSGSKPNSVCHASRKRLKTSHVTISSPPKYIQNSQPSPAVIPSSAATHFRDSQWGGETAVFSAQGNVGKSMKSASHGKQAPSAGKGKIPIIHGTDFKKRSDTIEIRATDKLIHEVERVIYGGGEPDPFEVEKAKLILKEHERAILEALDKLADVSDGEDSPDRSRLWYSHKELQRNGQRASTHRAFYGQVDRLNNYYNESFGREHTDRAGIPYDVQDDEGTP
ncbi:protein EMSY-LIKE 3-like isoform X2 [Telopea speciosissima]|uniref:protein EMSY-LIKE 3-like isoform X2 n=1 Tax=Telopea speciosissima TaxID=54955 RepID=UPI001CC822D0|nr:protein EMSY-LIKE 3-like isoform X2 [Telopea speciosissima]